MRSFAQFCRKHWAATLCLSLVTAVLTWFATYGTWTVFAQEPFFGQFYDAQARSLVEGHFDVPPWAISPEAFIVDGGYYGYFGVGPALLRIPLLPFKGMNERWNRFFIVLASVLLLWLAYRCVRHARKVLGPESRRNASTLDILFLVTVGLGSTVVFLAGRSWIYHEALAWGTLLALGYFYLILRYAHRPSLSLLLGASVLSILCVSTRAPVGLGTIGTSGLVMVAILLGMMRLPEKSPWCGLLNRLRMTVPQRPCAHVLVLGTGAVLAFGSYVAVNQIKFGTWLDGSPMHYYERWHLHRNDCWDGKPFRADNIPGNLAAYGSDWGLSWDRLPWFRFETPNTPRPHCYREPYTNLFSCMPALVLLSCIGLAGLFWRLASSNDRAARSMVLPAVGAFACWGPVLMSYTLTQRYFHDLLPFLILTGAFGIAFAARWSPLPRLAFAALFLCLAGYSIVLNCSASLHYQREQSFGVDVAHQVAFQQWKHDVNATILSWRGKPMPEGEALAGAGRVLRCVADADALPRDAAFGSRAVLHAEKEVRVFDGTAWRSAPWDHKFWSRLEIECDVTLPQSPVATTEPLCVTGQPGLTDHVFVTYLPDGQVAFGHESSGRRFMGPPVAGKTDEPGRFRVEYDWIARTLVAEWNGAEVLRCRGPLHRPARPEDIAIGVNRVDEVTAREFSGSIDRFLPKDEHRLVEQSQGNR